MALSVSLGKPLWGKKVNQGGVLFISTEDGIIRLKKRIWKMIGSPDKETPNFHFYLGDCILTRQGVMEALREKIQTLKPKLIVLDPFINLFRGRELNSAEDMNEVLRPLQKLAKDTGACVLVIHHVRKSAGNDSIDIIQGSITIGGVPDGILLLRNLSAGTKEKKAVLEVTLKDAEVPNKLVLKLDDNLRWTVEGDFEEITRRSIEEKIIRALSEVTDGLPIKSLEQITGYGYMPIYRCLGKLEEDNRIFSKPKGRSHTKFYFLKNEVKNENSPVASGNYSNKDHERSLLIKSLLRETQSYRKRDKEIADAERRISLIIRQRLKKT
ncbi:MAG TPA: AAA family ATPase [Thermodesulfobacteriota bacterium]|nr:AAA family ATPase [Thermodesulfobacteriota bacterium]